MGNKTKTIIEIGGIIILILFAAAVTFFFLIQTVFINKINNPVVTDNFKLKSFDQFLNPTDRYTKNANINKGIGRANPFANYK